MPIQGRFKGGPTGVVMQTAQDNFEPLIGKTEALDGLSRCGPKRPKPVGPPRGDVHQAMITPGQIRQGPHVVREASGHRWGALLPPARCLANAEGPNRPTKVLL